MAGFFPGLQYGKGTESLEPSLEQVDVQRSDGFESDSDTVVFAVS